MRPGFVKKFKTLALICLLTSFAGIIYQLIGEGLVNFSSIIFGLPLGLAFGVIELLLFPKAEKRFRQWSFTQLLVFKAVTYTTVIFVVSISITIVVGLM